MDDDRTAYRRAASHPVAGRLLGAVLVSSLGDFVGLGVLLLIMYERAGQRAVGPALLFAAQAVPALVLGTVGSPWLARVDPRRALTLSALGGAAAIGLVLATSGLVPVLVAAVGLGLSRSVTMPLRSGLTVSDVPEELRTAVISLSQASFQGAQVAGFLVGGTAAVAGLGTVALWFDLVTFVVSAALFLSLPLPQRITMEPPERRRFAEGLRVVATNPVARAVVPATWAVLSIGALPEAITPAIVDGYWVGPSLVAAAAATLVGSLLLGRTRWLEDVRAITWFALLAPGSLVVTGVVVSIDAPPWVVVASHALMGLAALYSVGAQAVLARTVARDDIVHLAALMGASLIVLEGIGAVLVGALLDAGGPLVAYGTVAAAAAVPILHAARHRPSDEIIGMAAENAATT